MLEYTKNVYFNSEIKKYEILAELRIIQNMQNRGYSINKIAEVIGKTEDEINNILNGQD